MIPMLRVFSRLNLRGIEICSLSVEAGWVGTGASPDRGHEKGPNGPVHDAPVGTGRGLMESASPLRKSLASGVRAQMSATPAANNEYSRGSGPSNGGRSGGDFGPSRRGIRRRAGAPVGGAGAVILAGSLLGALLLLVAEFTSLYQVHLATSPTPIESVSGGLQPLLRDDPARAARSGAWNRRVAHRQPPRAAGGRRHRRCRGADRTGRGPA